MQAGKGATQHADPRQTRVALCSWALALSANCTADLLKSEALSIPSITEALGVAVFLCIALSMQTGQCFDAIANTHVGVDALLNGN